MDPERWRQLEDLFARVASADIAERKLLLAVAEKQNPKLAEDVRDLLLAEEGTGLAREFEAPAFEGLDGAVEGTPPGTRIGGWLVERPIASGGMGEVLLARREDRDFQQFAALKLLREALRFGSFAERFARERRTLATLDHPNIAPLLDGGEDENGTPWLATRYIEGLPLDQYVEERRMGHRECARLMLPVCAAVHYAHQRLVVHRDLKPANILVTEEGQPILLDFGIAKLLDTDGDDAEEGLTRGVQVMTPEFASPEQVRGEPVSTASDVYALGVVLYRLICGALPQEGAATGWAQSKAVAEGTLTPARTRDPQVPSDLEAILQHALALDAESRYPSAQALADDLSRYLRGLPVHARRPTLSYRMRRFVSRNRWSSGFAAAALVALVGGTAAVIDQQRIALREAQTTQRVSAFLIELFDARDPWAEGLSGTTLEQLFDRGIQLAREGLEEEPEVRAELLAVLGAVLRNLGEEERAAELLDDALRLDPQLRRRNPERHADRLFEAGVALHRARQWEGARALLEDCLELRREVHGSRHESVASAQNTLGLVQFRLGERDLAIRELTAALEMRIALLPADHPDIAVTQGNLAAIALADGDTAAAVERFQEAIRVLTLAYPEGHPDRATAHNNLGMALHADGQDITAERELQAGLEMRAALLPDGHPHVAGSYNNLGLLYFDAGRLEDARAAFSEAYELARSKAREDHPLVVAFADNLAAVEEELAAE